MKLYMTILLVCLSWISTSAQYITGSPPSIQWSYESIWPHTPLTYTGSVPDLPADQTGEDWFYSAKVRYDNSHQPIGYVFGGYGTAPGLNSDTFRPYISSSGACGEDGFIFINDDPCDLRFKPSSLPSNYHSILAGIMVPIIGITDLDGGHTTSDVKIYPYYGLFNYVIPTSDGGYLGVGYLFVNSKINISSGAFTGFTGIAYNPTTATATIPQTSPVFNSSYPDCDDVMPKPFVMKVDANLNEVWAYVYGQEPFATARPVIGYFMHATEGLDGYIVAGGANNGPLAMKLDYNGNIIWQKEPLNIGGGGDPRIDRIQQVIEGGIEHFYIAGKYAFPGTNRQYFLTKLDAGGNISTEVDGLGNPIWQSKDVSLTYTIPAIMYYPDPTTGNNSFDGLSLAANGDLFLSGTSYKSAPNVSKTYNGHIYRVNKTNGAVIAHYIDGLDFKAEDLRYAVTGTLDGGCAISSTVIRFPINCSFTLPHNYTSEPVICSTLFDTGKWNSDAYIAKFDASLTKIWSTAFDAPTLTPGGTNVDIISSCSTLTSWEIPNQSGMDTRRQECIFDIVEAPDGGLVIAGKTSLNLDDCYIVKLCRSNVIKIENEVITAVEPHASEYAIKVLNTTVESTGKMNMESCHYILIDAATDLEPGSVVSAIINPTICCDHSGDGISGYKVTSGLESQSSSNDVKANAETLDGMKVTLFPNPTNGVCTLLLESNKNKTITVEITDPMGKAMALKKTIEVNGRTQVEINLTPYGRGIYAVILNADNEKMIKKVVVE